MEPAEKAGQMKGDLNMKTKSVALATLVLASALAGCTSPAGKSHEQMSATSQPVASSPSEGGASASAAAGSRSSLIVTDSVEVFPEPTECSGEFCLPMEVLPEPTECSGEFCLSMEVP